MKHGLMAAGVLALMASGCGGTSPEAAEAPARTASAAQCADGTQRLAVTGMCAATAISLLKTDPGASPEPGEGCEWKVMETQMVDDVLLYRGLKCAAGETKLEFAGGAGPAELMLVNSAYLGKIDEPPAYVYVYTVEGDASAAVTRRAVGAMEGDGAGTTCAARKAGLDGWPSDALVVDVSASEAAQEPQNEPRQACGPLGLKEDETSFWRVGQGYAWFFQLGQDAFEIDPGSFTLVTRTPDGGWTRL